jgi:hypothetical protein
MNIFGNEIETVDFAESKFYNLEQICKALDMEPRSVLAFMRQHKGYTLVQTKNTAWIDAPTLLRWMLVPELQKVLSPKALVYSEELFDKVLLPLIHEDKIDLKRQSQIML